jgi:hypothetical protein
VLLNRVVEILEDDIIGVDTVINSVSTTITLLKNRLQTVDKAIESCSKSEPENLNQILMTAQPPENTGSEGIPNSDYLYKGYTLEIIQDPNSPKIAPRRYAIAKDREGIERLRGEPSFSSNTQILLDELKFKIDNQFT